MGTTRKLEEIGQAMDPITTKKDLALFLKKPENAHKLNNLVQDIRYALMDYQVCTHERLALIVTDVLPRLRSNEICTMKAVSRS